MIHSQIVHTVTLSLKAASEGCNQLLRARFIFYTKWPHKGRLLRINIFPGEDSSLYPLGEQFQFAHRSSLTIWPLQTNKVVYRAHST